MVLLIPQGYLRIVNTEIYSRIFIILGVRPLEDLKTPQFTVCFVYDCGAGLIVFNVSVFSIRKAPRGFD
jgi:hypothetical protein